MTTTHGNDGRILIGANQVGEVTDWSFTQTARTAEDSAQGDTDATHKSGKRESNGSLTAHSDPEDTNGQALLVPGTEITLLLREQGTGSGLPQISVPAIITSLNLNITHEGINQRQFDYLGNGPIDDTDQA